MRDKIRSTLMERVLPEIRSVYEEAQRARHLAHLKAQLEGYRSEVGGSISWSWRNDDFPLVRSRLRSVSTSLSVRSRDPVLKSLTVQFTFTNNVAEVETALFPTIRLRSHALATTGGDPRLRRIGLGDSVLDTSLTCHGVDEYTTRRLLDRRGRELLSQLYFGGGRSGLALGTGRDQLVVLKHLPHAALEDANLVRLREMGQQITEHLMSLLVIETVDEELADLLAAAVIEERATCRVCGETILVDRVDCLGCETPHHRDCWDYTGICALYGCGSDQFRAEPEGETPAPA